MSNCWAGESDSNDGAGVAASRTALATAETVAETLGVAGLGIEFHPNTARLFARALRAIATGQPLTRDWLRVLAHDLGDPDAVVPAVWRMAEFDAEGRIIGLLGLSQGDHPHRFTVGGRTLTTWCAWDTLFLAPVLGEPADVRSRDPATGAAVELRVSPDGVEGPEDMVVSIVFPEIDEAGSWDAARAQELCCSFVHFFEDRRSAQRWFAERQVPVAFLPLAEAFRLGQSRFGALIDAARADEKQRGVLAAGAGSG